MPQASNRPQILLMGVNHKTAGVEVRERLALRNCETPALKLLSGLPQLDELVFLSTCNRVEVISATQTPKDAEAAIKALWLKNTGIDKTLLDSVLYIYKGEEAIRHVFKVASSLDSMVVGEPQILGQMKDAYRMAVDAKTSGAILNRLLHKAFSVAKLIRTETGIANSAVSISYAAVELAKKIFGDLKGKKALLVGAGEMAELAARHLMTNGISRLIVANRTLSRAVELAERLKGLAIALEEIEDALLETDIVISSTGAPGFILTKDIVRRAMRPRRHRLLFLIDIAVPRDIEPGVNELENVYLYGIDDLKGIVEFNKAERGKEAKKAERMVEAEVIKFMSWLESTDAVPVIQAIQQKAEEVRRREMARSHSVLSALTPEQQKAIDVLTSSIVQKILLNPIICLKKEGCKEGKSELVEAAGRLFGLNGTEECKERH
ncbi:MAG: glutamyl-tRNA reductase [Dissulfurimicrobium sp.]|uniref:glutamyl-tRNA reductase n=1 Tax=Dissulfurimicrobium TaxID=1769732 RepID=UPI001EDBD1F4|nr:glutamyl-tRNA reductase [Dissulfurimicrobium hydrothermale]UKL14187.1 glutamyl-tRNA reductase [Dissulfurimicrobium hydrothermale]